MTRQQKAKEWLDRLKVACEGITNQQLNEVLEYCRWVKIKKVNDDFVEVMSKFKNDTTPELVDPKMIEHGNS